MITYILTQNFNYVGVKKNNSTEAHRLDFKHYKPTFIIVIGSAPLMSFHSVASSLHWSPFCWSLQLISPPIQKLSFNRHSIALSIHPSSLRLNHDHQYWPSIWRLLIQLINRLARLISTVDLLALEPVAHKDFGWVTCMRINHSKSGFLSPPHSYLSSTEWYQS